MSSPDIRDQGLRRISRLTRWFAAAGVVAVGVFAGLLGRPTTTSATVTTGASTDQTTPGAVGSSNGSSRSGSGQGSTKVTPPTQPPVRSRQSGPAVSGGS